MADAEDEKFNLAEFPFPIEQDLFGSDDLRITFAFEMPFNGAQAEQFRDLFDTWYDETFQAELVNSGEIEVPFSQGKVTVWVDTGTTEEVGLTEQLNSLIRQASQIGTISSVTIELA